MSLSEKYFPIWKAAFYNELADAAIVAAPAPSDSKVGDGLRMYTGIKDLNVIGAGPEGIADAGKTLAAMLAQQVKKVLQGLGNPVLATVSTSFETAAAVATEHGVGFIACDPLDRYSQIITLHYVFFIAE